MSSKAKPQKAKAPKKARPFPINKDEIEILEHEAGSYYLLIKAIMQNKRLVSEIVDRYLKAKGLLVTPKAESDARTARLYPEFTARTKKIEAELDAAQAKIRAREQYLMDPVR